MSNKVVMETKAVIEDNGKEIYLETRGLFNVFFTKRSEIGRMLDVKDKEKFRVTIERI